PLLAKPAEATPGDLREGILYGDDHSRYPGGKDCLGAGGSLAGVAARFERDVESGAPSTITRLAEGVDLGMRPAKLLMPTLPDDFPLGSGDHGPNHRIRLDEPFATHGEPERELHEALVGTHWHGINRESRSSNRRELTGNRHPGSRCGPPVRLREGVRRDGGGRDHGRDHG